jgi:hypothetical protein
MQTESSRRARRAARPGSRGQASPDGGTPLFTRHMPGAIEAVRDARRRRRADGRVAFRYRSPAGSIRDSADAALLAVAHGSRRVVTQASTDVDRWTDEGGSFDAEVVASLRATASNADGLRSAAAATRTAADGSAQGFIQSFT